MYSCYMHVSLRTPTYVVKRNKLSDVGPQASLGSTVVVIEGRRRTMQAGAPFVMGPLAWPLQI